ncbi:MAG: SDR family NAD(P)-dependent oxidoreductase [Bacteroidota bacterium]|jgi:UDP-glucose 4-epimerase
MNKLHILVTGGAGFIGSHLCDQLLSNGHKVVAVDNLINGKLRNIEQAQRNPDFSFIQEDILNASKMIELTKGVDVIFHLACLGVRHSIHSPRENHLVNAEGSLNMLEAARANHVKHFYYISTSEIYGDVKTFPINEFAVPLPKTVYGSSKLAGENYAYSYFQCYQLPVTVLRIFNNYGPRAHYEGDAGEVIPRSIVNMLYGKNPIIFGDGSVTRDFFFVKDTAKVLSELINIKGLAGEIINIGTGEEITMKHLMEQLITLVNNGNHIEYLDDRPADVPRLWVDNAKFKTITGFKSAVSFEQGLTETINYYKDLKKNHDLISEIKTLNWTK